MIAPAPATRPQPQWHAGFLKMLPKIKQHARVAFSDFDPDAREEAVQDVIAKTLVAYLALLHKGKSDLAYPYVLAKYAVAQYLEGRRMGTRMNVQDISSRYCQRRKGLTLECLDRYDQEEGEWLEVLVEDRHAGPAEIVATKLDFGAWLRRLPAREKEIAEVLAAGETTGKTAKRFGVTPGRISQCRRELKEDWEEFVDDPALAMA